MALSVRGLAFAKPVHKGVQDKATGYVSVYDTAGSTQDFTLKMTDAVDEIERAPIQSVGGI